MGLILFAVTGQQEKRPCQAFLAGVKQLIDEIFLDADVPGQHVGDEAVRECWFGAERTHHLLFFNE
jgi:hypothetical protein